MHAVRPRHALALIAAHAATAHHVGADDAGQQRLHRQGVDAVARLRPRGVGTRELVHRRHRARAGRELDLGHREEGAARTVHHEVVERVVEHRRAVVAKTDRAAGRLLMEAIAHQGQQAVRVRELLQHLGLLRAMAGQRRRHDDRVQRRGFELVADRAVDRLSLQEVVGVDGLRCAVPAFDPLVEGGG